MLFKWRRHDRAGRFGAVEREVAAAVIPMAPYAPGRMISSSAQPNRNAVSGPKASRRKTYIPPLRGKAAASSA